MDAPLPKVPQLVRWGMVFLACPLDLDDAQKLELVKLAARAWFEEQPVLLFEWEDLGGELRSMSEVTTLGPFIGQLFEARVEGRAGKGRLRFLVTEAQLQAAWTPPAAEA